MGEPAAMVEAPVSLWRNRPFLRLWFAQVISTVGSRITDLAVPLTAVLVLNATPTQMGLLGAAGSLPNLIFGLFAGVWVDRMRRQPVLVGADLGRAMLLGSIPVAALLGYLTLAQLWVVAFASGILTVFFNIASVSILPSVVKGNQLVDANSKLATTDSVLSIAGPSVGGGLVQLLSAPRAIMIGAVSYVVSALSLRGVGASEQVPDRAHRRSIWKEIAEGVRELVRTPLLRALTISSSVGIFGSAVYGPVLLLFLTRQLGLAPATIGFVFACGGVGSLVGAILGGRMAGPIGIGRAVILGNLLWALGPLCVPFAGLVTMPLPILVAGQILAGMGATIYTINQISLRQHLTPVGLLGRVTAARRFLMFSVAPVGSVLGGLLGGIIGLSTTLFVGAGIAIVGVLVVFFSPVHAVRDLSEVIPHSDDDIRFL